MMSESTAREPDRIFSSTASIPLVNRAIDSRPTIADGALQTVRRAKRPIEVRAVPLTPLQVHQPFFQADQELARFFEEHLAEPVV